MLSDRCPVLSSVTLVYCSQTVEWIKMPLGTDVGLGPCDIVLDGTQLPHGKTHSSPQPPLSRFTDAKTAAHNCCAKRLDGSECHLLRR